MRHSMSLYDIPFQMIKSGAKTIELRLYDAKRKMIDINDTIEFINKDNRFQTIITQVIGIYVFDNFTELYKKLPLRKCGYTDEGIGSASPEDMNIYYSKEVQQKYKVVGIEVKLI